MNIFRCSASSLWFHVWVPSDNILYMCVEYSIDMMATWKKHSIQIIFLFCPSYTHKTILNSTLFYVFYTYICGSLVVHFCSLSRNIASIKWIRNVPMQIKWEFHFFLSFYVWLGRGPMSKNQHSNAYHKTKSPPLELFEKLNCWKEQMITLYMDCSFIRNIPSIQH